MHYIIACRNHSKVNYGCQWRHSLCTVYIIYTHCENSETVSEKLHSEKLHIK